MPTSLLSSASRNVRGQERFTTRWGMRFSVTLDRPEDALITSSAMAAGTPPREILLKVILPSGAPSILTGCRIGLVISCIVVFLAEMITSTDGLGHVLITAARTFQAVDMFVPLITISLLGLILNGLLQATRSYLLRGFPEV